MIIRREVLQAAAAATVEGSAYYEGVIQVAPDGAVRSTDGHIALVIREASRFPDNEFPARDVPEYHGDPQEPVLVPVDTVKSLIAAMPKGTGKRRTPTIPILAAVQIGVNGNGGVYAAATDLHTPRVARLTDGQIEQRYPAIDSMIPPADRQAVRVTFGVDVLQRLIAAAKAIQAGGREATITFAIPTERAHQHHVAGKPTGSVSSAIRVRMRGPEGITITGAAMPHGDENPDEEQTEATPEAPAQGGDEQA